MTQARTTPSLKMLGILTVCMLVLVILSYFFVDRAFATYIHGLNLRRFPIFDDLTTIKTVSLWAAFVGTVVFGLKQLLSPKPLSEVYRKLWVLSVTLLLTNVIKDFVKNIFGRYWPETWTNNNPSWISDQAYGFHLFHSGSWYQSFPSGHTTVMFCLGTCIWLLFPRFRPLAILLPLLVVPNLLLLDYHFVSDVIAGAYLGFMIAYTSVHITKSGPMRKSGPTSNQ